jgi:hypothetical protein
MVETSSELIDFIINHLDEGSAIFIVLVLVGLHEGSCAELGRNTSRNFLSGGEVR